ncbi:MAG: hypothetical protein Q9208_008496 [Pyrenodesmia sp. 3 TL-2023]
MSNHQQDDPGKSGKASQSPLQKGCLSRFSFLFKCPCVRAWLFSKHIQSQQSSRPPQSKKGGGQPSESPSVMSGVTLCKHVSKKSTSRREAQSVVRELCHEYLNSSPGMPNRSSNTAVQALAHGLINGEDISRWMIEELRLTLLHRLNLMEWATGFKNFLGLDFPDCNRFDFDQWAMAVPWRRGQDTTKNELFEQCRGKVRSARILPLPPRHSNHGHLLSLSYPKGTDYLGAMFTESGLSPLQINEALARLVQLTQNHIELLNAGFVRHDRTVRETLRVAFNSVGKRLRSPSTRNRGALASFDKVISR